MTCFLSTLRRKNLKTQQSQTVILHLFLSKPLRVEYLDYRNVIVYEKLHFQNVFLPNFNARPAFSNFSGLKSVIQKRRFCDGLVLLGLTVEINVFEGPFSNSSGVVRTESQIPYDR